MVYNLAVLKTRLQDVACRVVGASGSECYARYSNHWVDVQLDSAGCREVVGPSSIEGRDDDMNLLREMMRDRESGEMGPLGGALEELLRGRVADKSRCPHYYEGVKDGQANSFHYGVLAALNGCTFTYGQHSVCLLAIEKQEQGTRNDDSDVRSFSQMLRDGIHRMLENCGIINDQTRLGSNGFRNGMSSNQVASDMSVIRLGHDGITTEEGNLIAKVVSGAIAQACKERGYTGSVHATMAMIESGVITLVNALHDERFKQRFDIVVVLPKPLDLFAPPTPSTDTRTL